MRRLSLPLVAFALLSSVGLLPSVEAAAFTPPAVTPSAFTPPPLAGPVVDQAGILRGTTVRELQQWLTRLREKERIQLQILTVDTLGEMPIEQAALAVAEAWKLGDAETDKGVLFLIASGDRKMRIEVGEGLEGDLPDIFAKRIISDTVAPYFRRGDYDRGVVLGVAAIVRAVAPGADLGPDLGLDQTFGPPQIFISGRTVVIIFILIILFMLLGTGRRRRFFRHGGWSGGWTGAGGWSSGSGGWSSGSGGWSSGGGSWSGGGGGFSGGGASGGW